MQTVLSLLKMKANAQKFVISFARISSETQNLQPIFLRIYDTKGESLRQTFLEETVEIGNKNKILLRDRSHACFAKKAWERLNLEFFQNMSVHEFYRLKALITFKQVNTIEWLKQK